MLYPTELQARQVVTIHQLRPLTPWVEFGSNSLRRWPWAPAAPQLPGDGRARDGCSVLYHRQCPPTAEDLYRAKVNPRHHEARGERVAVAMPCIACQSARILTSLPKRRLRPVHRLRKELVRLPITAPEHGLLGILRLPPLARYVEQHRANDAVHRDLAGISRLGLTHREETCQKVNVPPLNPLLLAPSETCMDAHGKKRTKVPTARVQRGSSGLSCIGPLCQYG